MSCDGLPPELHGVGGGVAGCGGHCCHAVTGKRSLCSAQLVSIDWQHSSASQSISWLCYVSTRLLLVGETWLGL